MQENVVQHLDRLPHFDNHEAVGLGLFSISAMLFAGVLLGVWLLKR